jgi:hypothetical protein
MIIRKEMRSIRTSRRKTGREGWLSVRKGKKSEGRNGRRCWLRRPSGKLKRENEIG